MEIKEVKSISDIFDLMYQRNLLVDLKQGFSDVVNTYGWHPVYFIRITKIEMVCEKCSNVCKEKGFTKEYAESVKIHYGNCKWTEVCVDVLNSRFEFKEHLIKEINEEIIKKDIRGVRFSR